MVTHRYVVAVRRESRASAPSDWLETLGSLPGVSVVGASDVRAQVEATAEGAERIRAELGAFCHVEEAVAHHRS